jgi:hypothetical protein
VPWDIILTVFVAVFALVTFGAAINQRRRGGNLLSVLFFVGVTALAVAVTIYRLHEYKSQPPAPAPVAAGQPIGVPAVTSPGASAPTSAPGATPTELVYGKTVAERNCASCHQIAPDQPAPPAVVNSATGLSVLAPGFASIARDPKTNAASLRAFLTLPHDPMPDRSVSVTSGDLPYLTAYILSLRDVSR